MPPTSVSYGRGAGHFIAGEANFWRSRQHDTLLAGQNLVAGTVLGRVPQGGAAAAAAQGANAGNGTFGAITVSTARAGNHILRMQDATHFVVEDPRGEQTGHGTTGTAFTGGGLAFTLTAGGTAFVAGDSFVVAVTGTGSKVKGFDPAATDGSQFADGILFDGVDATLEDKRVVVMARDFEADGKVLTWPAGITATQKAAAVASLLALGIVVRA